MILQLFENSLKVLPKPLRVALAFILVVVVIAGVAIELWPQQTDSNDTPSTVKAQIETRPGSVKILPVGPNHNVLILAPPGGNVAIGDHINPGNGNNVLIGSHIGSGQ